MMLTGAAIYEEMGHNIQIIPFNKDSLNPNSYNLRLFNELKVYEKKLLDCKEDNKTETVVIPERGFQLNPGKLYLGRTVERTSTDQYVPCISGRSSIARLGVSVEISAGFGDVGFGLGHSTGCFWTLEISVVQPVIIYPWIEICQIYYFKTFGDITHYSGKYQNNNGIQSSKLFKELQ